MLSIMPLPACAATNPAGLAAFTSAAAMTKIERLQDRIEELEQLLGIDEDYVMRLHRGLKLSMMPCRVLGFIAKRASATKEQLYVAVYGEWPECDQPGIKNLGQFIWLVRQRLTPLGIEIVTDFCIGFSMTAANKRKLAAHIDDLSAA